MGGPQRANNQSLAEDNAGGATDPIKPFQWSGAEGAEPQEELRELSEAPPRLLPGNNSHTPSTRLVQSGSYQFQKVFGRHRAMRNHSFMVTPQFKPIAQLSLDLLPEPIMSHPPHEIGAELRAGLLGANELEAGLALRLKGTLHH